MLNNIVYYMTDGYWENTGEKRRKFDIQPGGTLAVNIIALTPEGQQLARWALDSWSHISGLGFQEVTHNNAHITFDDNEPNAFSYHVSISDEGYIVSARVNVSTNWLYQFGTGIDSYSFQTYIHEIGHALGLGHPGPYNGVFPDFLTETVSFYDSWQTTVMSYIDQSKNFFTPASYAHVVTPMIADIMAIHKLYGAPDSVNAGNTTYGYNSNTGTYLDEYFRVWTGEGNPFRYIDLADIHQPAFLDVDYDGDIDMVTLNHARDTFFVYDNIGTSTTPLFRYQKSVYWGNPIQDYAFIDIDGDGDTDIVIADNTGIYLEINSPDNQPPQLVIAGYYVGKFELSDMDGDGDFDFIETLGNQVYYAENIGTASVPDFAETFPVFTLGHDIHDFKIIDSDADGDHDFVAVDSTGGIYLYENTGSSTTPLFTADEYYYFGNPLDSRLYGSVPTKIVRELTFADLDNDNDLDFVSIDNSNSIQYFENIGTAKEFYFVPTSFNRETTITIYDTGGTDRLDFRTDVYDQWIDLNPPNPSNVYGLIGNLVIAHDTVIEIVVAGRGDDTVFGNEANNVLNGYYGNDLLFGNDGNDTLRGSAGDDLLRGDRGNDQLTGGTGADVLVGGLGDDRFYFSPNDGDYRDEIVDFTRGKDRIDLSDFDTIHSVQDIIWYDHGVDGKDALLDLTGHGGGEVVLTGYDEEYIYDSDFIFTDSVTVA